MKIIQYRQSPIYKVELQAETMYDAYMLMKFLEGKAHLSRVDGEGIVSTPVSDPVMDAIKPDLGLVAEAKEYFNQVPLDDFKQEIPKP